MRRRTLLQSLVATLAAQTGALASSGGSGLKEFERRKSEITAKAIAAFPFQRLEVRGEDALATWEKLTIAGRGCPIVIGDDIALVTMMGPFDVSSPPPRKSVEEVLAAAKRISVPDDLFARRKKEDAETLEATKKMVAEPDESLPTIVTKTDPKTGVGITTEYWYVGPSALSPSADPESHVLTPDETRAWMLRHPPEPPVGEWPDKPAQSVGLSVATDIVSGKWHPKVHIAIIPTDDWTTIPAHLRW